ncbi:GNAT family N-acetyltransferase [Sphingobium algorifonticola]|uniref:GNAT family N-acetyltransferase n=1 Tax=Sphingobium algorifonticola TaxID=2008318 RepID=UPI0019D22A1C|nr:GNAT family protein [Sphingobium algorifonticola]
MIDVDALIAPITAADIAMTQLVEADREALRAICPVDDPVWDIYPIRLAGVDFDAGFEAIVGNPGRYPFAIRVDRALVGISGYLNVEPVSGVAEIGGTYMTPSARGTGLNGRIKPLLLDRAFASGVQRVEFRIDARNGRSLRAVEKLGAVREGVLRRHRRTWTGHIRDTVMLSILREEWAASCSTAG